MSEDPLSLAARANKLGAAEGDGIVRCDACPVMCYIKPGAAGACDRYANQDGQLVRVDPHIVLERTVEHGGRLVPFQRGGDWENPSRLHPWFLTSARQRHVRHAAGDPGRSSGPSATGPSAPHCSPTE